MKYIKFIGFVSTMGLLVTYQSQAQIRINRPARVIERQAEYRANRRIDQAVDKSLDKLEEGVVNIFKKKEKKEDPATGESGSTDRKNGESAENQSGGGQMSGGEASSQSSGMEKPGFQSYSKFDFVPGEKIVASEDFSQDAVGDFPAKWNTNATAEVVTIEGYNGKWLMFKQTKAPPTSPILSKTYLIILRWNLM